MILYLQRKSYVILCIKSTYDSRRKFLIKDNQKKLINRKKGGKNDKHQ
jgi:hypothetical protein